MLHVLLKLRGMECMHLLMHGRRAFNTIMCLTDWVYLLALHTTPAQHPKMKLITFYAMILIYYNPCMDRSWMMWLGHKKQIIGLS